MTTPGPARASETDRPALHLSSEQVWHELENASFAVLSYVTPAGDPRSSGVVFAATDHRLYVVTAPDSWKARRIADGAQVAVTVPVRRGGLLSLVAPIPPATVSFHAIATVHPPGTLSIASVSERLARLVPPERRAGCVIELVPQGSFMTYGIGVSLRDMAHPATALAHAPVG